MTFITGLNTPTGIAIKDNTIYIGSANSGDLYEYDFNGTLQNTMGGFLGSLNFSLAIYNDYMFATRLVKGSLATIDLSQHPYTISSSPGSDEGFALDVSGNYMYVSNQDNTNRGYYSITQIDLTQTPVNYTSWRVDLNYKPYYLTIYGDYLYISNQDDNSISCIELSTQTLYEQIIINLFKPSGQPSGITTNYNYLFIANSSTGDISQYDITNPKTPFLINPTIANVEASELSQYNQINLISNNNNTLYALNTTTGNVYNILSPTPPVPPPVNSPIPIHIYLQSDSSTIFSGFITLDTTTNLVTGLYETIGGVTNYSNNLLIPTGSGIFYQTTSDGFTVYEIPDFFGANNYVYYDNGFKETWKQFDTSGIIFYSMSYYSTGTNFNLFASNEGDQTKNNFARLFYNENGEQNSVNVLVDIAVPNPHPPTPVPISNICFLANTPIHTNKGIVPIGNIEPNIHTIDNKKIIAITKTIAQDKYLICFKKNSLGNNYPFEDTIMSKNHKILYKGKMIEAYKFLDNIPNVKKIKYNGEILYNILMKNYDTIKINNLICETLSPSNIIAKIYTSNISQDYKDKIIVMINDSIIKNDYRSYKKIVNRIL